MYSVDVQSAADAFLFSNLKVQVGLAFLILQVSVLLVVVHDPSNDDPPAQNPLHLPSFHPAAIALSLQRRFDFLNDSFRKTGEKLSRFNMLRVRAPPLGQLGLSNIIPRGLSSSYSGSLHEKYFSRTGLSI